MFKQPKKSSVLMGMLAGGLVALLLLGSGEMAIAVEKYPAKDIKMIGTHPPGTVYDTTMRIFAPYWEKELRTKLVIEGMPGGAGRRARAYAYHQKPDGYTLLFTGYTSMNIGELLFDAPYKTLEFTHIGTLYGYDYHCIAVKPDSPIKNFNELVEIAKDKKRSLKMACGGMGATDEIISVMLKKEMGRDHILVPFQTDAENRMAVLGGKVDAQIIAVQEVALYKDVRPLALVGAERSEFLPEVPTITELGYKNILDAVTFMGILGPPKMPKDITDTLIRTYEKAYDNKEMLDKIRKTQLIPMKLSGEEFKKFVTELHERTKPYIPLMLKEQAK